MKAYKTVGKGFQSRGHKWKLGKWYSVEGDLELFGNGFHGSKLLPDAFGCVIPYYVCAVETKGEVLHSDNKFCSRSMRITDKYRWTKKDSVEFSVWCARRVIKNFERVFPDDNRPRLAIEAAESYLNNPCKRTKDAAESAAESARSAAESAESAGAAAWSAAWSAESARAAADSAARSAAESAGAAAWSAARAAAEKQAQHKKILSIIKNNGGFKKWMLV